MKEQAKKIEATEFHNFRLRRIVKENHLQTIHQLQFATGVQHELHAYNTNNILVTVGAKQLNIYDNQHYGDHLDLLCHFELADNNALKEKICYLTVCWIKQPQDLLLAVSGKVCIIHIISLAFSKEVRRLKGHEDVVTDLQPHLTHPEYILSSSKDKTIKLWNIETGEAVFEWNILAHVMIYHSMTVRNASSNLCRFDISSDHEYICVGNSVGIISIYSITTGKLIKELHHKRSNTAVRSCAFSYDCRNILYCGDGAFIWRYDWIDDLTLAEWNEWQSKKLI